MQADVAVPVVEEIKSEVRADLVGKRVDKRFSVEDAVKLALRNAVEKVLQQSIFDFDDFVGIDCVEPFGNRVDIRPTEVFTWA